MNGAELVELHIPHTAREAALHCSVPPLHARSYKMKFKRPKFKAPKFKMPKMKFKAPKFKKPKFKW